MEQLYRELEAKGLTKFRPEVYLTDEWGCPSGEPIIGIPFYLASAALAPVEAHDLYRSESRLVVRGREVSAQLTFNLLDFPGVDQNGDKVVSQDAEREHNSR